MGSGKKPPPQKQALAQDILFSLTHQVRQSLELQEILSTAAIELQRFLKVDRTKIYRFDADGHGQVIAESVNQKRLPALQGLFFPATDIPPASRELFIKVGARVIVDISTQQTTLSQLQPPQTAAADLSLEEVQQHSIANLLQRAVDPCHVEYLNRMGVQSSLVVPILHQQDLWGLLIAHHSKPHRFSEQDLQVVQGLADQVAIAISQSYLLHQAREKAKREELINHISTLLHLPLPIGKILQLALEQAVLAVGGSGGRLYLVPSSQNNAAEICTYGSQPSACNPDRYNILEDYPFWQTLLNGSAATSDFTAATEQWADLDAANDRALSNPVLSNTLVTDLKVVADVYQEPALIGLFAAFQPTLIRSLLILPLHYGNQVLGCLTLFRNEIDTDIVWAGKLDPDQRQNRVRESFAAWRQLKQGQANPWTIAEQKLVRMIGTHLTLAVMHWRLYQYEHEQRLLVEMRNQELRVARTAADAANRLKSDFLASTSHELRTPLASTLNYLTLLKEGFYDNPQEMNEYISIAHQSASNLVAIINDILDIAKIEAGRMSAELEPVDLLAALEEQSNLFRAESRRKGIALVVECDAPQVIADRTKLRQVLTNLLANAFKFTSSGEVRISAFRLVEPRRKRRQPPLVQISIQDTGIGIDPAQREQLFEPFVQADGSIKRRYGGTGLGLTVCKRLVELMNGTIHLESSGIGRGLVVTFTLPSPAQKT